MTKVIEQPEVQRFHGSEEQFRDLLLDMHRIHVENEVLKQVVID